MITQPLELSGAPGSPYTRKMCALLRYRHISYRLIVRGSREDQGLPEPKVRLMPTFYLDDASGRRVAVVDSTPLIRRFEREHAGRSVLPRDPVLAILDQLLEDYGDEWLTKAMFHYRWVYEPDIEKAAQVLPRWSRISAPEEEIQEAAKTVSRRQIERLWVVGSNETTAPVIEESYRRFLRAFDAHLRVVPFLLGHRPAASDFALFGQLTQLALFDPTPMAVTLEESPRVYAWVELVQDLSGLEPRQDDWIGRDAPPETLRALLGEVGRVYTPVMLANARALRHGDERVECEVDGRPWVQRPFPYQGKCLHWLRESYAGLAATDRVDVDAVLSGTGCEPLFAEI